MRWQSAHNYTQGAWSGVHMGGHAYTSLVPHSSFKRTLDVKAAAKLWAVACILSTGTLGTACTRMLATHSHSAFASGQGFALDINDRSDVATALAQVGEYGWCSMLHWTTHRPPLSVHLSNTMSSCACILARYCSYCWLCSSVLHSARNLDPGVSAKAVFTCTPSSVPCVLACQSS